MNALGCSFLTLAILTLLVGFVPFLTWINVGIALPLAVISLVIAFKASRKHTAQAADRAAMWVALALVIVVSLRIATL